MAVLSLLFWFLLLWAAGLLGLLCIQRRGREGWGFALVAMIAAAGTYPLFQSSGMAAPQWRLIGLAALVLLAFCCFGLRQPKRAADRCRRCGYALDGETEKSSTCCPECGEPRPSMQGHCLQCKADIRQALAGGSIICPYCGGSIARS